jgi:hypothetical protein
MLEDLFKYFLIYISSSLKFIFGPLIGAANDYNVLLTGTLTMLGMMTSVYIFTYFGTWVRHWTQSFLDAKDKKVFTPKNRRYVKIWLQYGVPGLAFLTPILLTPIGGTVIANAFGGKKNDIIKYMWLSCIFWSYLISWMVKFAGHLLPFLHLGENS